MCNTHANEHFWVIGSNTSKISAPYIGQPCQCGSVFWKATQQPRVLDEVHAERTISMSCPSCHRLIEVVLLASLRQ